jgi:N-acetyl-anhydromuramyl-L-alanine amidase AmpD
MSDEFTPTHIIIHHSLTKDDSTVSWQAIRIYHVETEHWLDIGYHFGIERINYRYETLVGRSLTMVGAHCKEANMNRLAFGICCVGNYDDNIQVESFLRNDGLKCLAQLVRDLRKLFFIPMDNIHKHSTFATYKTCPGSMFPWGLFMELVAHGGNV